MLVTAKFILTKTTRAEIRKEVIGRFLNELPGTGKGSNSSQYHYTVETIGTYSIVLKRPAVFNKGFDFTVNVKGLFFNRKRNYSNPTHNDIIAVLTQCKNTCQSYSNIQAALTEIYNCRPYKSASLQGITFKDFSNNNHPIEIILLATKWLFIEQDITYWNWSGRNMLWDALSLNGLV